MHWRTFLVLFMLVALVVEITDPSSNFVRIGWEKYSQNQSHDQDDSSPHFQKAHTHCAPLASIFVFEVVIPEQEDYICFDHPLHDQFSPPVYPPPNIA